MQVDRQDDSYIIRIGIVILTYQILPEPLMSFASVVFRFMWPSRLPNVERYIKRASIKQNYTSRKSEENLLFHANRI